MTVYWHIDRLGEGSCGVVTSRDASGRATDICGCAGYGCEPTEDSDGVLVCAYCGHDVREMMADELVAAGVAR